MSEIERNARVDLAEATAQAMAGKLPLVKMDQAHNVALVPDGYSIERIQGVPVRPEAMNLKPLFFEAGSLAEYVNRFWTKNAVAFTDWQAASIYVDFCFLSMSDEGQPGDKHWSDHAAKFVARKADPWRKWFGLHDKLVSQRLFIRFLEERAHEIVTPDAASVIDVCMNFEAVKKVEFKSSQRLSNGYRQFLFTEENSGDGRVEIPEIITIMVPIFEGQEPVNVQVRMRYDISDGKLTLGIAIDNVDEILKSAFERCLDTFRVGLATGPDALPVYKGDRG